MYLHMLVANLHGNGTNQSVKILHEFGRKSISSLRIELVRVIQMLSHGLDLHVYEKEKE